MSRGDRVPAYVRSHGEEQVRCRINALASEGGGGVQGSRGKEPGGRRSFPPSRMGGLGTIVERKCVNCRKEWRFGWCWKPGGGRKA